MILGPVIGLIFSKTDWLDEYKPKVKTFDFDPSSFISEHKIIFSSTRSEDLEGLIKKLELNLENIKLGNPVPNFELLSLPKDLNKVEPVIRRKEIFFSSIFPLILRSNMEILNHRKNLCDAFNSNNKEKIAEIASIYKVNIETLTDQNIKEVLLKKVDAIPFSLALAQAAVESGWGTSRFALEGNALYGQWVWNEDLGIKPKLAQNGQAVVRSFENLFDSVKSYMSNLNNHKAYSGMRSKRQRSCIEKELIEGYELAEWMGSYAETREEYIKILRKIISSNNLDQIDQAINKNLNQ